MVPGHVAADEVVVYGVVVRERVAAEVDMERAAERYHPPRTRRVRGRLVHCRAPTLQPRSRDGSRRGVSRCLSQVADQNGAAAWW